MMAIGSQPLRVLSLDGGGMRGTYTATYLDRVAAGFSKRRNTGPIDVGAAFDLIVGTSTGGIIACALATGIPLQRVVGLYREHGPAIFRRRLPSSILGAFPDLMSRRKVITAGQAALRQALEAIFGKTTLIDVYRDRGIALAIPTVEMSQHRAWVFKTPHLDGTNHRDDDYTLVDVCLATSAAPIYRCLQAIDRPDGGGGFNVFADGGLWANNPVLVGLVDALDLAQSGQEIQIFSLGTCPMPAGEQVSRDGLDRGLVEWRFGGAAAELAIDAQQFAFDHMAKKLARHLGCDCRVVRFPSDKVPASLSSYLHLDETRSEAVEALISQARSDADMTNAKCGYPETDQEGALICQLFDSAPLLECPLVSRKPISLADNPSREPGVTHV